MYSFNVNERNEYALMYNRFILDKPELIKQLCQTKLYLFLKFPSTFLLDLSDGAIFIASNEYDWVLSCVNRPPTGFQGNQTLIATLPCACSLKGLSFFIPASIENCDLHIPETYLSGVNLMGLYNFYDTTVFSNLTGITQMKKMPVLPNLFLDIRISKWQSLNTRLDNIILDLNTTASLNKQHLPIYTQSQYLNPLASYMRDEEYIDYQYPEISDPVIKITKYIIQFLPYLALIILVYSHVSVRK